MSSGVEADIALDAAVIATLGLNRVLGGAAGLAGSGARALAALAEGKAETRAAALAEAERYATAVHAVIERNARIVALTESTRRASHAAGVALPSGLTATEIAERTEAELTAWCAATDSALSEAEHAIQAGLAAELAGRVFAVAPASLDIDASVLADPRARAGGDTPVAAEREQQDTVGQGPARAEHPEQNERAERIRALARVLSRLPADTADADVSHVAAAAERLAGATTPAEAEGLLNEVRLRVQEASRRARERREALRRATAEREAQDQAEAERRYVLESVVAAFNDMGYQVDTGFETLTPRDGTLVLTRSDRPDHAVKMRVDELAAAPTPSVRPAGRANATSATLRAALVRTQAPESEEERRLDVEREREWCEAFEAARHRLEAAGLRASVTWRVEPGDQTLPVAPEARHTRTRQRQRERRRAREAEA